MNLEDVLNEISQAQRDKYGKISTHLRYLESSNRQRQINTMVVAKG